MYIYISARLSAKAKHGVPLERSGTAASGASSRQAAWLRAVLEVTLARSLS